MAGLHDEKLAEVVAEDEAAASSTRSGSQPGEVTSDAWRSGGTPGGKLEGGGHPWDAFFNAPQASTAPEEAQVLPLEDAKEAIVDRAGGRMEALAGGDEWPVGADGKITDTRLSHLMCRVLRYHIEKLSVSIDEDGWVPVPALLAALPELERSAEEDVRRVVKDSVGSKGSRFELRERDAAEGEEEGTTEVRATYRHPRDGGRRALGGGRGYRHRGHYGLPYGALPAGSGTVQPYGYRPGFSRSPLPGADEDDEAARQAAFASVAAAASRPPRAAAALPPPAAEAESSSARATGYSLPEAAPAAGQAAEEGGTDSRPERWGRWFEPETNRVWFQNEATGETFFADDADSGWERFEDAEGRPWWWSEVQGRYFFEEE